MLHEFLRDNRTELIDRCRVKVAGRRSPRATPAELEHGIPIFLDQLAGMLQRSDQVRDSVAESEIRDDARLHGSELLGNDFTIDQVVHDYGDLCQSITELASEREAPITVAEFGILNIRLDNAIAAAVTEYARGREVGKAEAGALAMNERLGELAHEMRNLLNTAILAVIALKSGGVGFGGATAAALDRSLIGMRSLMDRTLAGVRLEASTAPPGEAVEIGPFIAEIRLAAALEASQRGCELVVAPIEPGLVVEADRHILASAVSNLLQNAFKYTQKGTQVALSVQAPKDRVTIEVHDQCGGLPPDVQARLFRPFSQHNADRSGVGLGLSLSRRGVEAYGGTLTVRELAGHGCVFTIDLPRRA